MTQDEMHKVFIKEVEKLDVRFPVADLVKKTEYKSGTISEYLSSKKKVSPKFFKAFCKAYNLDYDALTKGDNPQSDSGSPSNDGKEENGAQDLPDGLSNQNDKPMTDRLLDMLQQALDNNTKLSNAQEQLTHTHADIVKMLRHQIDQPESGLKRQAS